MEATNLIAVSVRSEVGIDAWTLDRAFAAQIEAFKRASLGTTEGKRETL